MIEGDPCILASQPCLMKDISWLLSSVWFAQ